MSNETRSANLILLLDLADDNPVDEALVRTQLPADVDPPVLRLSDFTPRRTLTGTLDNWHPILAAIDRLLEAARRQAAPGCRFWIAGRAGLPGNVYLGYRLGKQAIVTLVNQRPTGGIDVLELDTSARPPAERQPYFKPAARSQPALTPVAIGLIVSAEKHVNPEQIVELIAKDGLPAHVVEAQAEAPLAEEIIGTAVAELDAQVADINASYPNHGLVHLFVAGPATLAFMAGRALNQQLFPDIRVYEKRQPEVAFDTRPQRDQRTILFLAASPSDLNPLDLEQEARDIEGAVPPQSHLRFVARHALRLTDLRKTIRDTRPVIVHFSGHGNQGHLALEREDGTKDVVTPNEIDTVLDQAGVAPAVIVLSACYSEPVANRLLDYAYCVIAMRTTIHQDDAVRFATALYTSLGEGDSVQVAVDDAKRAIRRPGTEVTIDVRPGIDATQLRIFRPRD